MFIYVQTLRQHNSELKAANKEITKTLEEQTVFFEEKLKTWKSLYETSANATMTLLSNTHRKQGDEIDEFIETAERRRSKVIKRSN